MSHPSQHMVREFHEAFNHPVSDTPAIPSADVEALRHTLLDEEYLELREALFFCDLVEVVDALADIVYIAAGTTLVYGIGLPDHIASGVPVVPRRYTDFTVPDEHMRSLLEMSARVGLHIGGAADASLARHLAGVSGHLSRVVALCYEMAAVLGVDLDAVLREVHRSNMAKVGPNGAVEYRADGKVIKPAGWKAPDIRSILAGGVPASA